MSTGIDVVRGGIWFFVLASLAIGSTAPGQSTYMVSGSYDSKSAPSAAPLPGLRGRFREQILIAESRLAGLKGKTIHGVWVRRELHYGESLVGGKVALTVRVSTTPRPPAAASEFFSVNAPAAQQSAVFSGSLVVPDSPALGTSPVPWSAQNSIKVTFAQGFTYSGGTLVLDLEADPDKPGAPKFWYVDHEHLAHDGTETSFGQNCSRFSASGLSLLAESRGLQIGGTSRLVAFGQPGASPLLLLGASQMQPSVDLNPIGAPGCFQHVNYFVLTPLIYEPVPANFHAAFANLYLQVPADPTLISAFAYLQSADIETGLPPSQWSNAAGLTTSNGLKLQIASSVPSLGMAIVVSREVPIGVPLPTKGRVDVERAPVIRLMYL